MSRLLIIFIKFFIGCLGLLPIACFALTYNLPAPNDDIIGDIQYTEVEPGDNFNTIGHRYDVGYYELIEANPGVDPEHPGSWAKIVIPMRKILPPGPRRGIVINLAEMRLYYFLPHSNKVIVYPVGIGREGWLSPLCTTKIKAKETNPTWNVPVSIRADRAKDGVYLPKVVLPGPENPLGNYAMRLAVGGGTFLVHGTNDPDGIGRRSSSGCIRMLPQDIKELFHLVPIGTMVRIMSEAIKVGVHNGHIYIESHVPLQEQTSNGFNYTSMVSKVSSKIKQFHIPVDWNRAKNIAEAQKGIPESASGGNESYVSNTPPPELSSNDVIMTTRHDVPKIIERDDVPSVEDGIGVDVGSAHSTDEDVNNILEQLDEA